MVVLYIIIIQGIVFVILFLFFYDRSPTKDYYVELFKTAKEGDPEAQEEIADMYCNGEGEAQDFKESIKWYTRAYEQGHKRHGMRNLSTMCFYGYAEDMPPDHIRGYKWMSIFKKFARDGIFEDAINSQTGEKINYVMDANSELSSFAKAMTPNKSPRPRS